MYCATNKLVTCPVFVGNAVRTKWVGFRGIEKDWQAVVRRDPMPTPKDAQAGFIPLTFFLASLFGGEAEVVEPANKGSGVG
jgi:hypothetical protein